MTSIASSLRAERGVSGGAAMTGVLHSVHTNAVRWMRECEWMPTVLREGPYRFFFYASDRGEPAHIHVERENKVAKFWLNPPRLARSGDFGRAEIRRIEL